MAQNETNQTARENYAKEMREEIWELERKLFEGEK